MADWNAVPFFLALDSADFFSDFAILIGSSKVKTPGSKSKALLSFVTFPDQYFFGFPFIFVTIVK